VKRLRWRDLSPGMRIAVVAIALMFGCFILAPKTAHAGAIFRGTAATIRLTDKACDPKVARLIGEEEAKAYRLALVTLAKGEILACWTLEDDKVIVFDEGGDSGYVRAILFSIDGA
jgi:hypothetical protein